jgi:hypothetical protein
MYAKVVQYLFSFSKYLKPDVWKLFVFEFALWSIILVFFPPKTLGIPQPFHEIICQGFASIRVGRNIAEAK